MNAKDLHDFLRSCCKFFDLKYKEMDKMKVSIKDNRVTVTYENYSFARSI